MFSLMTLTKSTVAMVTLRANAIYVRPVYLASDENMHHE